MQVVCFEFHESKGMIADMAMLTKTDKASVKLVQWLVAAQKSGALAIDPHAKTVTMSVIGASLFTIGTFQEDGLFIGIHESMSDWWFDVQWIHIECILLEHRINLVADLGERGDLSKRLTLMIHDERGAGDCIKAWAESNSRWRMPFRVFKIEDVVDHAATAKAVREDQENALIEGRQARKMRRKTNPVYYISEEVGMQKPVRILDASEKEDEPGWMDIMKAPGST